MPALSREKLLNRKWLGCEQSRLLPSNALTRVEVNQLRLQQRLRWLPMFWKRQ